MKNDSQNMRILQISTADFAGGAEKSAKSLFDQYRARGYKSWLAVGYKHGIDPDVLEIPRITKHFTGEHFFLRLYDQLLPLEGRIRGISYLRNWIHAFAGGRPAIDKAIGKEDFYYPGSWHLLDLVPQKPDIVHAHNLHGGYFDLRFLAQLSHQVPLILNLRDAWLLSGHCAHSFNCDRWKTGCGKCPDLKIYPAIKKDATAFNWKRKKAIYAKSRFYITTPSQWLMDKVDHSMLHGVDHRVIPNGIDLNTFHPEEKNSARVKLGLPIEPKIVLFAANNVRSNKWKDYATMESAISHIADNTDIDLIFLCLGDEGEEKKLGRTRVLFKPFESDTGKLAQYYQASDLYIHAANAETFPRTIIEALACGVPVVATAVGGIPEQIIDGITGFLVPYRDSLAMALRIEQLLIDDDLRLAMSNAAAEEAHKRYSLERQVDTFLAWYQEIIENTNISKTLTSS